MPEDLNLMTELDGLTRNKKNILRGQDVVAMRKELIPAISRKVSLVSGSEAIMIKTRAQAELLIKYYHEQMH